VKNAVLFDLDASGLEVRNRYEKNLSVGHWFIPGAEALLETVFGTQ